MVNDIIDDGPMTVAEFLATREALHLPQQFIAKRLGVSRETVSRWERGQCDLPQYAADEIRHQVLYRQSVIAKIVAKITTDTTGVFILPLGDDSENSEGYPAAWSRGVAYEAQRFIKARIIPESMAKEFGLRGRDSDTPNVSRCDIAEYSDNRKEVKFKVEHRGSCKF